MPTWTFVKRAGAPAGAINISVTDGSFTIDDASNTTFVTTNANIVEELIGHPYVVLSGGVGGAPAPQQIQPVELVDGVLSKPGPLGSYIPFTGSELPQFAVDRLAPSGDVTGATDAANIQTRVNAGAGAVWLAAGNFYSNATINVPSNVRIWGVGKNATLIQKKAALSGGLFNFSGTDTSHRCQRGGLADLQLHGGGHGSANTGPLITAHYADHMNFERVWCNENPDTALEASELWDTYFVGVEFEWCGAATNRTGAVAKIMASSTASSNEVWFVQCRWESFPANALFIDSHDPGGTSYPAFAPYGIYLNQCKMESNSNTLTGGHGFIEATADVSDVHIRDIYLAWDAGSTGSGATLINHVGSQGWVLEGIRAWVGNTNLSSVIRVFSGTYGNSIKNVYVVTNSTKPTNGIVNFAGGSQVMRVENVRNASSSDGVLPGSGVYSGTVPDNTRLVDFERQPIVWDTFDGTAGTVLTAHTGQIGAIWTGHPSFNQAMVLTAANRARPNTSSISGGYSSGVPVSGDYSVQADIYVASIVASSYCGITARMSTTVDTEYVATLVPNAGTIILSKRVAGAQTDFGTYTIPGGVVAGTTYTVKAVVAGSNISLYVGGVLVLGPYTDSAITQPGRAGYRMFASGGPTDTTEVQFDNFIVQPL